MKTYSDSPGWLLVYGMPKCGTTTLSALLNGSNELAVHAQKEPNDFFLLPPSKLPRLSGYRRTRSTRYYVDCSTQYGMPRNRSVVLDNLIYARLMNRTRFLVCLRDPEDLARSYYRHLVAKRGTCTSRNRIEFANEIDGATDFSGLLLELLAQVDPSQVFVVKFADIVDLAGQRNTICKLGDWLEISPFSPATLVAQNRADSARRYPDTLRGLISRLREFGLVRRIPSQFRSVFSKALSYPVTLDWSKIAEGFDVGSWVDPRQIEASREIYQMVNTGPLNLQMAKVSSFQPLIGNSEFMDMN